MRLQQVLLLIVVAAERASFTSSSSCENVAGYDFVEGKDSYGNDIRFEYEPDVDDMADLCDDETQPDCKAFNTLGYLKHTVVHPLTDLNHGECCGLYIRCLNWAELKTAIANDQTPSGQQTEYTLCSGQHTLGSAADVIHLDGKNVVIGCSNPETKCYVDGAYSTVEDAYAFTALTEPATMNVELKDLTIRKFKPPPIVLASVGTLTVKNCKFQMNYDHGSVLVLKITSLILQESEFIDNERKIANSNAMSGGVTVKEGNVMIDQCLFDLNDSNEDGGAVHCSGSSATCTVASSTFTRNKATDPNDSGGAIYCDQGASCDVNACSFAANEASQGPNVHCNGATACDLGWVVFPGVTSL